LALGCWPRLEMKSQPHRSLEAWRQRHGAGSARIARAAAACSVESRLLSGSSAILGCIARSAAVGVASFGAGLRSSSRRRVWAASRFTVQRCVAVRPASSGLHPARLLRPASLPNNSLEPTLVSTAPSLRVGGGAAQLNRYAMKHVISFLLAVLTSSRAFAYEPDVKQQREEHDPTFAAVDHLIPSGYGFPEDQGPPLHYIARFGTHPSFSDAFEWCLFRKDRRYLLSSWRLDKSNRKAKPGRVDSLEIEVPEAVAAAIYTIWANAILNARYARQGVGLDGTSYTFSTFLRGVGWLNAITWSPSEEMPPKWLAGAGEEVLAFARSKNGDSKRLLERLRAVQHSIAARPNKTMEPTR
jgi:hypothetical protein